MTLPPLRRLLPLLLGALLCLSLAAPARADGRAQLHNDSSHNIGVLLHFKKDPPERPAPFAVLAPSHETDDDFELVGLYLPAEVALSWPDGGESATTGPRIARVADGQQLRLSDPIADPAAPAAALEAPTYRLNLPLADLLDDKAAATFAAERPAFSQADLDAQPESAPTD
jgi:hypothetical protein